MKHTYATALYLHTHTHIHTAHTHTWISFLRPAHPSYRFYTHLTQHLIYGPGGLFELRLAIDQPALCKMPVSVGLFCSLTGLF